MHRTGLDVGVLARVVDKRHLRFRDALIASVQASLADGAVIFTVYPNYIVSLHDMHLGEVLRIMLRTWGIKMSGGAIQIATFWRACYCMTNTVFPSVQHSSPFDCSYLQLQGNGKQIVPKKLDPNTLTAPEQWKINYRAAAQPQYEQSRYSIKEEGSDILLDLGSMRSHSVREGPSSNSSYFFYFPCQKIHSDPETINIDALINKTTEESHPDTS